jgi:hypothetical protein
VAAQALQKSAFSPHFGRKFATYVFGVTLLYETVYPVDNAKNRKIFLPRATESVNL